MIIFSFINMSNIFCKSRICTTRGTNFVTSEFEIQKNGPLTMIWLMKAMKNDENFG